MKTTTLLLLLCLVAGTLAAQPLHVTAISPAGLSMTSNPTTVIIVDFDLPIHLATVQLEAFKVFGRWSGPTDGTFYLENNNTRIRFIPVEPFFAGEIVTVSVNKLLQTATGETLEHGYIWSFGIRTLPGSLSQVMIEEIELRQPGEGLLQTYGAYAGDLNNDGYSDLTAVNETSDDLRILLNNGSGGYTTGFTVVPMGNEAPSPSEGGDFNGDGEIDLVVTNVHGAGETRVLFGNGQGQLSGMTTYTTGQATRAVGVFDLEGDGDDDIVVANRDASNFNLLWNDGTGVFTVTTFDSPGLGETALAVTDANGDGRPDLFVGYYAAKKIALLLGDGAGGFTVSATKDVVGQPWQIASGDLNGDGFADVVGANSTGHNFVALFGDGQGGLSAPVNYPGIGQFPLSIDLGDVDGDGDLDVVTSQYDSNNFGVFGNNGDGSFAAPIYLPSAEHASCAILHDRDNDGDLDISGTDEGADVIRLFDNPGVSPVQEGPTVLMSWAAAPNPFSGSTRLTCTDLAPSAQVFDVTDLAGRHQRTFTVNGSGHHDLDASGWAPGVYWLRARGVAGALKLVKLADR